MIPYNPYVSLACLIVIAVVPFVQGFELYPLAPRDLLLVGLLNITAGVILRQMQAPGAEIDPDRLTKAQTKQVADELERRMKRTPAPPKP